MSTLLLDAILFAEKHHRSQKRRISGFPYATHPMRVSYIVAAFKRSKNLEALLAACWLHDILEDTNVTYEELEERFGKLVASIVQELTSDKAQIKLMGKTLYLEEKMVFQLSNYALVIKLADCLHNMSDHPVKAAVSRTVYLMNSLEKNRKLTKTQWNLVIEICEAIQKNYIVKSLQ